MILVHRKQLYRNVWGINHLHMQRKQVTCTTFTSKEIWLLHQMRWIIPLLMKSLTVILLFIQKSLSSNCDSLTLFVFVFFLVQYHSIYFQWYIFWFSIITAFIHFQSTQVLGSWFLPSLVPRPLPKIGKGAWCYKNFHMCCVSSLQLE